MSSIHLTSYFWFVLPLVYFYIVKPIIFWIVAGPNKEKVWNEIFYFKSDDIIVDSQIDASSAWSFLIDPEKFVHLNRKIKWVRFGPPLRLGSEVKIRIKKGVFLKGFVSFFKPNSKLIFEYYSWPGCTRFILDIEMIQMENKTRYVLTTKVKSPFSPVYKMLYPRLTEKMAKFGLGMLHNALEACEKRLSEQNPQMSASPL